MSIQQKILIIDDNPENIKVAANIIKNENRIIWAVTDAKKGIETAKTRNPDIILLDVQMPEIDGFEVCKILKEDITTKEIPIIFMTAMTDNESIEKAFKAGAVDYITKPVKSAEIIARVDTHLRLSETIKELKKSNKIRDKMFEITAHDLRGPIGNLMVTMDMFNEDNNFLPELEKNQLFINLTKSVKYIFFMIENLYYWAEIQKDGIEYFPEKIKINELLNALLQEFSYQASEKEIIVENFNILDDVFYSDRTMLEIVLKNIFYNAIKFTERKGTIKVKTSKENGDICISIEDTGIGIKKENINSIFEQHEKEREYGTEGEKGTGFGLYVSREFVKKIGGQIECESKEGKGSVFRVKIPNKK